MDKRLNIEGSPASKMIQLMRQHGKNKDVTIDLGTVRESDPNIVIQLDSDGLLLERGDLVIAASVFAQGFEVGDKVIVIGDDDTQFYYVIDKAVVY